MNARVRRTGILALCALALVAVAAGTAAAGGEAEIEAGNVTTDLEPGMTTRAMVDVTNEGSATAYHAEVNVLAEGGVVVDGASAPRSSDVIGDLEPGETHTVALTVSAGEAVSPGEKPLTVSVTYRNESGGTQVMENANLTIQVMERQDFSIVEFEDTLTVGYDGEIRGVIRNDGHRTIDDGVLRIIPGTESFVVNDRGYALPTIEPGETAEFSYAADVSGQADPGPRQVQFSVAYATEASTPQQSPLMVERAVIDEDDSTFDVRMLEPANGTIAQGETREVVLKVTNRLPETISAVDAKFHPEDPFSSGNDETFVDSLAPNETVQVRFGVTASADAAVNTYPLEVDFQYETAGGQTVLSEPYYEPLEVAAAEDDDALPLGVGAGGLAVILAILVVGFVLYRLARSNVTVGKVVGTVAVGVLLFRPLSSDVTTGTLRGR